MINPLVLDFDQSVHALAHAARVELGGWQEAIRFGCRWPTYRRWLAHMEAFWPEAYGTVFMGSGDYHHVSHALIERVARRLSQDAPQLDVVVFDNHPDNMRFPLGIHCGSWVAHVATLPRVRRVHVLGMTSADVSGAHAWENHLWPLYRNKVRYWTLRPALNWPRYLGLGRVIRNFKTPDDLIGAFLTEQSAETLPVYVSIDKDVFSTDVLQTNWDQGVMQAQPVLSVVEALSPRIAGSDVTGEISAWQYETLWKRWLSQLDGQDPAIADDQLAEWQQQHATLNAHLGQALMPRWSAL